MKNKFKSVTILIFVFTLSALQIYSQVTQEWVARYNGTADSTDYAYSIAVDDSSNVYVAGSSVGVGTNLDYVIIKYNSTGVQQWVQRYNSPGNGWDGAFSIVLDDSGNVYVTGWSVGSGTCQDYATIKYNSSGIQQWVQRYNGLGNNQDQAYSIEVDGAGNVYVTGFSLGSGTGNDYATIKYNSFGVQQWVQRYNGPGNGNDHASSIEVDDLGNVYVTGESTGIGTNLDYATIKYNSSGVQQWVQRYNGPGNNRDAAHPIEVDGYGNVYVTGYSFGIGTNADYTTIKYNTSGVQQWLQRYNGPGNIEDDALSMTIDSLGNVYVTGYSVGSGTGEDYATIKYNSLGVQRWIERYSGPANVNDYGYSIVLDNSDNVYVTGYSTGNGTNYDYATIKYSQPVNLTNCWDQRIDATNTWALANSPNGDMYAGGWAGSSGIYRSVNGGINWTNVGLPGYNIISVVVNNNGDIYAGSIYNGGVYKSTNNGINWTNTLNLSSVSVECLAKNSTGTVYAGTKDGPGIYRTTNNGNNWTQIGLNGYFVRSLLVKPNGDIFAGTSNGLYLSTNNGGNWNQIAFNGTMCWCMGMSPNNNLYVAPIETGSSLYKSTNNGATWLQIGGFSQNYRVYSLLVDSDNNIFAGTGGDGFYVSTNAGSNWQQNNCGLVNQLILSLSKSEDGYLIAGHDWGISRSLESFNLNLNLKVLIEGFYYPGAFSYQVSDTIKVFLTNSTSPYSIVDSSIAILDMNGNDTLKFMNAPSGTYYIIVKHRNSIETWSKSGGEVFSRMNITNHNFTTAISQAFGNNLKLKGTNASNNRYCIYSGDVNQDGVIDATDLSFIDNDAYNFLTGYVNTDVNGDSFVDAADLSISNNNAFNFVSKIRP